MKLSANALYAITANNLYKLALKIKKSDTVSAVSGFFKQDIMLVT